MNLFSEDHIGHYVTIHTFTGNKNSGVITDVTPEAVSMAFNMPDKDHKGNDPKEMVVTIRQDRIESYGELTK